MSSIPAFSTAGYPFSRNVSDLLALGSQFKALSTQVSTGRVADTYGELGIRRSDSLSARTSLSALSGYDAA